MSLYAVAKKAGCSSEALYKWRDRKTSPSSYLLESISYALDLNIIDLLSDDATVTLSDATDKEIFKLIKDFSKIEKAKLLNYARTLIDDRHTKKQA